MLRVDSILSSKSPATLHRTAVSTLCNHTHKTHSTGACTCSIPQQITTNTRYPNDHIDSTGTVHHDSAVHFLQFSLFVFPWKLSTKWEEWEQDYSTISHRRAANERYIRYVCPTRARADPHIGIMQLHTVPVTPQAIHTYISIYILPSMCDEVHTYACIRTYERT